jgi:predicted NBD/HSP70 family sugar kinase
LRELSRGLVLRELARWGPLSQADVVRRTGLSRATVASIVTDLRAEGRLAPPVRGDDQSGDGETGGAASAAGPGGGNGAAVSEGATRAPGDRVSATRESGDRVTAGRRPGRGRPPALLQLAAGAHTVVGVDFGHSHLAVAVADRAGTVLAEDRVPLDVHASAPDALDRAAAMMRAQLDAAAVCEPPAAVVMGVPGPVDLRTGTLRSGTVLPGWEGLNPAGELSSRTGLPVTAENDANLGAVGEHRYGAVRGIDDVLYVKVSSGIGAGVILGGRLYRGSRGTAGEIGHVQVREDGALCRCGSRGCLETVSSADAALALLSPAHRRSMTVDDLIGLADRGDPGTVRLLTDMGTAIGRVVAALAANLDPAVVVVGGSVTAEALLDGISAAVRRYTQPYVSAELTVVRGALGARAGLLGAVSLAIQAAATV